MSDIATAGERTAWARNLASPVRRFLGLQTASAGFLLAATVAAVVWANSPWPDSYESLWTTTLSIQLGDSGIALDLRHWINQGLMTFFFLVVGLEAKRELDVGRPRPGETVVVSAAAGGVGSVAGQIARIKGCRVIGIAGGPVKCRWLVDELGFDAAIDYKAESVADALEAVDVFFDNVGGEILDAVLVKLARGARIVLSGGLSQYNADRDRGPANYLELLRTRSSMTGFITPDYSDRYPEAVAELAGWLRAGRLIAREEILHGGIPAFPDALLRLFAGENLGKLILAVGNDVRR